MTLKSDGKYQSPCTPCEGGTDERHAFRNSGQPFRDFKNDHPSFRGGLGDGVHRSGRFLLRPCGRKEKEFALLRVMGTSRRKLAGILLKETLILSVSGGAAGVFMGLLVVIPFSGFIETGLKLPFLLPGIRETGWLAFAAMAVICLAGPAASAYAVLRLSRVDPATILREGE